MVFAYYCLLIINMVLCGRLMLDFFFGRNPFFVIWFSLLFVFYIPAIFDPMLVSSVQLPSDALNYLLTLDDLVLAQLVSLIFLGLFSLLKLGYPRSFPLPEFPKSLTEFRRFDVMWTFLFLACGFFAIYLNIVHIGIGFSDSVSFTDFREETSFGIKFLANYSMLSCSGLAFAFFIARRRIWALLIFLCYFFIFLFLAGGRQPLIALLLPFFSYFAFSQRRPRSFLVAAIIGARLILFFLAAMLVLRGYSSFTARIDALMNFSQFHDAIIARGDESSLRFVFYYFVKEGDSFDGFGNFLYLVRLCFFWLPSFLDFLSIKPNDFEFLMFARYNQGQIGTMHPLLFGVVFADALWWFPVWVFIFFFMTKMLSFFLSKMQGIYYILFWGVLAWAAMMFARGAIYGPFVVCIFSLAFFSLGNYLGSIRFKLR